MDQTAYIDAMARAAMCATFAIADANEGNPFVPPTNRRDLKQSLSGRIAQVEEYTKKAREALDSLSTGNARNETQ